MVFFLWQREIQFESFFQFFVRRPKLYIKVAQVSRQDWVFRFQIVCIIFHISNSWDNPNYLFLMIDPVAQQGWVFQRIRKGDISFHSIFRHDHKLRIKKPNFNHFLLLLSQRSNRQISRRSDWLKLQSAFPGCGTKILRLQGNLTKIKITYQALRRPGWQLADNSETNLSWKGTCKLHYTQYLWHVLPFQSMDKISCKVSCFWEYR